ncbi:histidine kinase dimerization/phospho-acceptor domain-containing protein [Paraburkholderia caledonica]|uniref:histidine kinase dimerization/phospho-acceptor domain-containing protein n=1 Tax=Paraburkholderia caledonica TaxID=134536 RepID=UPI0026BE4D48
MADRQPDVAHLDGIIRFNEAMDQAIADSARSSAGAERERGLFLEMPGHDIRSPVQPIQATASYLAGVNAGERVSAAGDRLTRTGARMQALLDDLCDLNRMELGLGIRIVPTDVDLAAVSADGTDQLRAAHPDRRIVLVAPLSERGSGTVDACSRAAGAGQPRRQCDQIWRARHAGAGGDDR